MKIAGISLVSVFFLMPLIGSAQEKEESPEPMKLEEKKSWTDLTSKNGVKIQYKFAECHDNKNDVHKENVLLRYENTNDKKVQVKWDHLLWYDGECKTCGGDEEYAFSLELAPGEVRKGSCAQKGSQKVKVFASYLKKGNGLPDTELTGIRLSDLRVE